MVDYATTSIKKLEYTKIKMVDGTTGIKIVDYDATGIKKIRLR